jgi:hypothetical protein
MMRILIVLCIGLGIGYTYGYLHGEAGEDSMIDAGLDRVGVHQALGGVRGSVDRVNRESAARQALVDSLRQARLDSIDSSIHR